MNDRQRWLIAYYALLITGSFATGLLLGKGYLFFGTLFFILVVILIYNKNYRVKK